VSDRPKFLRHYRRVNACEFLRLRVCAIGSLKFPAWCVRELELDFHTEAGRLTFLHGS